MAKFLNVLRLAFQERDKAADELNPAPSPTPLPPPTPPAEIIKMIRRHEQSTPSPTLEFAPAVAPDVEFRMAARKGSVIDAETLAKMRENRERK
jgi:hypothetical protein